MPLDGRSLVFLGVILFVVTYAKYILKYSAKEYFKLFFHEFRLLLQGDFKPSAINAFGVTVASFVLVISFLMPQAAKLLSLSQVIPEPSDIQTTGFAVATFILLASFLCVQLIRPRA